MFSRRKSLLVAGCRNTLEDVAVLSECCPSDCDSCLMIHRCVCGAVSLSQVYVAFSFFFIVEYVLIYVGASFSSTISIFDFVHL